MIKRYIYQKLRSWKQNAKRKPLILRGARQVGKTHILTEFAKNEYQNLVYLNFEEEPEAKMLFAKNLQPKGLIEALSIRYKIPINPKNTLIFFDEIQECNNALNSLKYFAEQAPEYSVAAAGSLLGVKLAKGKSFPVGKVNLLDLKPLSFYEFLDACGEKKLREHLQSHHDFSPINEALHEQAISLLKRYFIIGGMPEVVAEYVDTQALHQIRDLQKTLLNAYMIDFSKYATAEQVMKIMAIWKQIPMQLAKENKKFIFSAISPSARAREYELALQWLDDVGLIYRSHRISAPRLPLEGYSDTRAFKVYLLDVGLLGAMSKLPIQALLEATTLFSEFKGALVENYVAQLLSTYDHGLYYWGERANAEVDFIVQHQLSCYPLEVKAGISKQKKSLLRYVDKYQPPFGVRVSLRNFAKEPQLLNYPLYAIENFASDGLNQ